MTSSERAVSPRVRRLGPAALTVVHYLRLLLSSVLLFVVVITVLFFLLEIAPGDPVQTFVGDQPISEEFRAAITASFGLDRPLPERYLTYLLKVFSGDLGTTYATQQPVAELISSRIGNTLALAVPSFILSTTIGIVLGAVAARTRIRALDGGISAGAVALFSIPNFWFGMMLITLFALNLGWLPTGGRNSLGQDGISLQHLILPVLTLASSELAFKIRIMRTSTIEALGQDFIDTARSKGMSPRRVLWRHGLPNAMLPMVTVLGYSLGHILAGSVLVESVFRWPGIGLLFVEAIAQKNNQVVLGVVIMITITILIANILTDIVYGLVDPRLRARGGRRGALT